MMADDVVLSESYAPLNASFVALKRKESVVTSPAQIFNYAGSERSCLTCFLVLRLEQSTSIRLLWSYPLSEAEVAARYPNLVMFAMANAGTSHSADHLTYTFVLTDGHGMREYGHVTAFVNGEAVVALSPYPWCNFFYRLAYLYSGNGEEHGRATVRALARCPTPPSGAEFLVPLELGLPFHRPYDRLCSFIDTAPLAMLTLFPDTDVLFGVLADLLLEKHVVVVGPHFAVVSSVVMSLQALIAPFDWMHILIPILPSSLIDVLAAPPPYLVGMLTSQLPLMRGVVVESVVLVHLGPSGVCERVEYRHEESDTLPHSGTLSAVRIGLSLLKLRHPRDQTVRDLCSLFLTYYASLFGEVVLQGGKGYIRRYERAPRTVAFFEKLLRTQSFNILNEEVNTAVRSNNLGWLDNEFVVAVVRGHPELYPSCHACLIREEQQGGGYFAKYGDCFGSRENFTSWTAAVHGFGGHQLSITRLLGHSLCSRLCRRDVDDAVEDTVGFYPGSVMHSMQTGRYGVAVSDTPVIVGGDEATTPPPRTVVHVDQQNPASS